MIFFQIFVWVFYAYLLIGLLFGLWFVFRGVNRVDTGMKDARWNMRLLLLPGALGLWPTLLVKYFKAQKTS